MKNISSSGEKVKGFVTAGHLTDAVGQAIYIKGCSDTKIGTVTKRKYSGKIDAAFVKITNSNYTPSLKVYYSDSKGTIADKYTLGAYILARACVGDYLYKSGSTTFLTKGIVESTSATIKISSTGVVFNDLLQVSYVCDSGDSGGAVFHRDSNCLTGIHKASGSGSGYAIKFVNIADAWNLYEY